MALLERGEILNQLRGLLDQASAGTGRLLFIGGEAGIGKTALVRHFTDLVGRSARVLEGACDPLSTPRPLGPVHDIADRAGGELATMLARQPERTALFGTILASLSSTGKPSVVVIEDAHWADEGTLDLLRFLGRRIDRTSALLLVTFRDDEVGPDHPLRRVLGDLATAPAVSRTTLGPLSLRAVATLAAGSRLDSADVHERTGGNPFFVTEVLAAEGALPATVRDAVLTRAARLSPTARDLLDTAAIVIPPIDPALLTSVAESGLAEIDECLRSGMLQTDGRGLAFRHEIGRQSILAAITLPRRIELHRRVLRVLAATPAEQQDLPRLAHHAEEAGDREAVLTYARAAGDNAARLHAHREAAAQYARALRFADGLTDADRERLLRSHFFECAASGRSR